MMLGDVCNIIMGQAPSGSSYNEEEVGLPLIAGAGDLGAIYPTPTRFTSSPGKKSIVGDIILCIRATIGTKNWADKEYCLGRGVAALRPKDPTYLIPSYLWHWVTATEQELIRKGKGATFLQVSKSDIEELPCNLPPLEEQQRIAAILDKADALRRKRADSLKLADEFLKNVFLDMFGDPVTNPKGWDTLELCEVAEIISGVTKGKKYNGQQLVSVPYMRVANVQDGHILLNDIKYIDVTQAELQRYELAAGDLLLTEGGDPDKLGRGAIWQGEVENCIHQNHIFRVRITAKNVIPDYLNALVGSQYGKRYFMQAAKQTTGIASINKTQLSKFPAQIPPLDLQEKFAGIVQKVEAHKQRAMQGQQEADDLFKALQQQFFS